jgi:hypothetical protein
VRAATAPVPFVVRSTVSSCMMIGTLSEVKRTSFSQKFTPTLDASRNALRLFSA